MNNVLILDCTLRDGGYINNWNFGEKCINGIICNLIDAQVDIVECGFIRNVHDDKDSSVFGDVERFRKLVDPKNNNTLYALMLEVNEYIEEAIPINDGKGADIIRVTFHKDEWERCKHIVLSIMEKGYKVCVQPIGTSDYSYEDLRSLIENVNDINPYAFYLVDTLGVMYKKDVKELFNFVDKYLNESILVGFHSHNNNQMSFANAQEAVELSGKREIILDTACYGMGRGAGNLPTELLIDYINTNFGHSYSLVPILNIIDKYLMPIYAEHRWGYDLPYMLSAMVKCHPNYASYLLEKGTLTISDIERVLLAIPINNRSRYNPELIGNLYREFQSFEVDDREAIETLRECIGEREVLIIGSGASILTEINCIRLQCKNRFVIAVNFLTKDYELDAVFISNKKRVIDDELDEQLVLTTSNISVSRALIYNYSTLLGEDKSEDNAGAMLIRLLKKVGVKRVLLAGFDGFDVDTTLNFAIDGFKKAYEHDSVMRINEIISKQLQSALEGLDYKLITRTKYEI